MLVLLIIRKIGCLYPVYGVIPKLDVNVLALVYLGLVIVKRIGLYDYNVFFLTS